MKTEITYRVRPEHLGYSHEDFEILQDAINRANERNAVRRQKDDETKLYKGDNCIIQKVTTTIEEITF